MIISGGSRSASKPYTLLLGFPLKSSWGSLTHVWHHLFCKPCQNTAALATVLKGNTKSRIQFQRKNTSSYYQKKSKWDSFRDAFIQGRSWKGFHGTLQKLMEWYGCCQIQEPIIWCWASCIIFEKESCRGTGKLPLPLHRVRKLKHST